MKIVLDTNVLIAAALKGSLTEQILRLSISKQLSIIISEEIIVELSGKLLSKFGWRENEVSLFVDTLRESSKVVVPTQKVNVVINDPDDNKIVEAALEGKADLIVSIDQDLLKIKKYQGIAIVHPKTLTWIIPKLFEKK